MQISQFNSSSILQKTALNSDSDNPLILLLYAASREPEDSTEDVIDSMFSHIQCSRDDGQDNLCTSTLSRMHASTRYVQLKTGENYTRLNELIRSRVANESLVEVGRLFYLSVPSLAYSQIAQNILLQQPQHNPHFSNSKAPLMSSDSCS